MSNQYALGHAIAIFFLVSISSAFLGIEPEIYLLTASGGAFFRYLLARFLI